MANVKFLVFAIVVAASGAAGCMPPSWAADALLHPSRRQVLTRPKRIVQEIDIEGQQVKLRAWWFRAEGQRRGTVVYLHGVGDNRGSGAYVADIFVPKGFDVLAYDSRAHGESTGDACTYGFHEKRDLIRVLNDVNARPTILMGSSLGAAVALQTAAEDDRIAAVISIATFSDLRTIGSERAPFFASRGNVEEAFRIAEQRASFRVDDVSPVRAASQIRVPVLLIHGDKDSDTSSDHSRRVQAALRSPNRLIVVPNTGHNDSLTPQVWKEIEGWLEAILGDPGPR